MSPHIQFQFALALALAFARFCSLSLLRSSCVSLPCPHPTRARARARARSLSLSPILLFPYMQEVVSVVCVCVYVYACQMHRNEALSLSVSPFTLHHTNTTRCIRSLSPPPSLPFFFSVSQLSLSRSLALSLPRSLFLYVSFLIPVCLSLQVSSLPIYFSHSLFIPPSLRFLSFHLFVSSFLASSLPPSVQNVHTHTHTHTHAHAHAHM